MNTETERIKIKEKLKNNSLNQKLFHKKSATFLTNNLI